VLVPSPMITTTDDDRGDPQHGGQPAGPEHQLVGCHGQQQQTVQSQTDHRDRCHAEPSRQRPGHCPAVAGRVGFVRWRGRSVRCATAARAMLRTIAFDTGRRPFVVLAGTWCTRCGPLAIIVPSMTPNVCLHFGQQPPIADQASRHTRDQRISRGVISAGSSRRTVVRNQPGPPATRDDGCHRPCQPLEMVTDAGDVPVEWLRCGGGCGSAAADQHVVEPDGAGLEVDLHPGRPGIMVLTLAGDQVATITGFPGPALSRCLNNRALSERSRTVVLSVPERGPLGGLRIWPRTKARRVCAGPFVSPACPGVPAPDLGPVGGARPLHGRPAGVDAVPASSVRCLMARLRSGRPGLWWTQRPRGRIQRRWPAW